MAYQVNGYYLRNGILYSETKELEIQEETHTAMKLAAGIILGNEEAIKQCRETMPKQSYEAVHLIHHDDSLFWLNMYLLSRPDYHSPGGCENCYGCGGCGSMGGGGRDGDACAIALLVLAIIALVASIFAAVGFTIAQGIDAEKTRKQLQEIQTERATARTNLVQEIYDLMQPIIQKEHVNKVFKTTFTATIAVGCGFLTLSAAFALYAVIHQLAMSPHVNIFAITGGVAAGVGSLGHVVQLIVNKSQKDKDQEKYLELVESIRMLGSQMVHPQEVLEKSGLQKVYTVIQGVIFAKDGDSHTQYTNTVSTRNALQEAGYIYSQIENRE